MSEKKLVPKRRFAGFDGEWKERFFFDNIDKIIDFRGRTPKKLGLNWSKEGYLALSALNVKDGYIDMNADAYYGSQELYDKWMIGQELEKGQVLFTTEAPMGNVAQVPDDKGYILSQRTIAFDRNPEKITNDFMATLLRSNRVFTKLSNLSSGGTAKGVSQGTLAELKVFVSSSLNEQQKIGEFFKLIDKRIANQEQKIAKTKALKSAYLTEMFPQEGETVPKRRFSGFNDEWQESKLGSVFEIVMGHSPKSSSYTNDSNDFILVQGNADIKNNKVVPRVWTTEATKLAYKNDLILTVRAPVGIVGKTEYDIVLGRGVAGIKANEFIFQYLLKLKMQRYWESLSTGSTFDSVNSNDINNVKVMLPSIQEQQKIGEFFKNLDDQIALEEAKLAKLKQTKEAYLEEMFV